MARFDSADLLARVKRRLNRPTTDEVLADSDIYAFLTEAQDELAHEIATHAPESMWGAPTLLTSADSGLTYTFGTDADSATIVPLGHVQLMESKTGPVIAPGNDWDNTTDRFVFNGATIRWPGQRTRTFSDGPYARFVTPPGLIDGSTQPTIPKPARLLLVYLAAMNAAQRLGIDPTPYRLDYDRAWPKVLHSLKVQYHGTGIRATGATPVRWWSRLTGT